MKLTLKHHEDMGDWYVIERAEHDGRGWLEPIGLNASSFQCSSRFSDADVEGTGAHMLEIAEAIEQGKSYYAKRCSVRISGGAAYFESPRNSRKEGWCTLAEAQDLARLIRETVRLPCSIQTPGLASN